MDEQIEERIEKEFTDKYLMYHRLETAHAFWNEKPKKKYQFWKKDEAIEESIRKKVAQRLKNLKSNR